MVEETNLTDGTPMSQGLRDAEADERPSQQERRGAGGDVGDGERREALRQDADERDTPCREIEHDGRDDGQDDRGQDGGDLTEPVLQHEDNGQRECSDRQRRRNGVPVGDTLEESLELGNEAVRASYYPLRRHARR